MSAIRPIHTTSAINPPRSYGSEYQGRRRRRQQYRGDGFFFRRQRCDRPRFRCRAGGRRGYAYPGRKPEGLAGRILSDIIETCRTEDGAVVGRPTPVCYCLTGAGGGSTFYGVIVRLGGDEFGVILENLNAPEDALKVARHIVGLIAEPVSVAGETVCISTSVGAAVTDRPVDDAASLVTSAERMMFEAKSRGHGQAAPASDMGPHRLDQPAV